VKFAWLGGDLQAVCASEKLLRQRFAGAATSVQHVLTVLAHADTMRDVRAFHSLQLFLVPPTQKHQGRLLIRHKEIDVTMELLADDTTTHYESDAASPAWMDPIRRVGIVSIVTNA
jgi:hypothetical protein